MSDKKDLSTIDEILSDKGIRYIMDEYCNIVIPSNNYKTYNPLKFESEKAMCDKIKEDR